MGERSGIQIAAWVVAAGLLAFAGLRLLHPSGGGAAAPVRLDPAPGPRSGAPPGRVVYVHVAGAVRHPGLLRVPASARVAVAVRRAGGAARGADLTAVNLAARLHDGEQVIVPRVGGDAGTAQAGPVTGAAAVGPKLGLGTASVEQLDSLDGIGPTLAQRIVDYRQAHGGFRSLEQLREVDGIGEKRFATLKKGLRP
jgi:competence protein ComEA